MLSSMHKDIIVEFNNYPTTVEMQNKLEVEYGDTSKIRLML